MNSRGITCTIIVLSVLCCNGFAQTPTAADLNALRAQLDAIKADYDKRIQALEMQVQALQTQVQTAPKPETAAVVPPGQPPAAEVPAGAQGAGGPTGALPVYGGVASSKVFNPDIAVIGDFLGAAGSNKVNPDPALELHESEAAFQAIVDPYARADFFISFGEQGVNLEEGYLTFPAIPGGLLVKVGKMRAAFGKINTLHNHVLPWTDRPLVTTQLVGGEDGINDAGLSVARLIPNPWIFLEATGQVFRGDSNDLFKSSKRGDVTYVGHLRGYQDITENTNIDLGVSFSRGHNAAGVVNDFDLGRFRTTLYGADATIRWRPLKRSIYHSFVGRSEFVWSRRGQPDGVQSALGYYFSGDYQFARRWFAGVRYDRSKRADDPSLVDKGQSAILTYWPSEFSQVRGQYRRTQYAVGPTANEFLMQFQFSIGAHGAHPF
ncbi:MAG: hypothetical protein DMG14_02955 [Acidobacteria bacterium]|nr:MAG: hypothetical protein DMG14_02955 [Acidobacteriota bacterium]